MFFLDCPITTKIVLLSSCCILLLTIWNQPIIQEETIEGRDASPPHSSNFIQDWISKLCHFFCPVEAPLEDSHIFLKWLHTLVESFIFPFLTCLLHSDRGQIFSWQTRLYSGCLGLLFLTLDPGAVTWHLHALSKFPWATRILDFLTHLWKAWVCAEELILPV